QFTEEFMVVTKFAEEKLIDAPLQPFFVNRECDNKSKNADPIKQSGSNIEVRSQEFCDLANSEKVRSKNYYRQCDYKKRSADYQFQEIVTINEISKNGAGQNRRKNADDFQVTPQLRKLTPSKNVRKCCENRDERKDVTDHAIEVAEWFVFLDPRQSKIDRSGN